MPEVSNTLFDLFAEMNNWDSEMEKAMLTDANLQQLLDLSERWFSNPIVFTTMSLSAPACTRNIPTKDKQVIYAIQNHVYSLDMIDSLIKSGYIIEPGGYPSLKYTYTNNLHKYPVLKKTFPENISSVKAMLLFNENTPPSPSEYDLAKLLCDKVERYLTKGMPNSVHYKEKFAESVLSSIIEGRAKMEEIDAFKLFFEADNNTEYTIYAIKTHHYSKAGYFIILNRLSEIFKNTCLKLIYEESVLLIEKSENRTERQRDALFHNIKMALNEFDAYCGYMDFSCITNLQHTYKMANSIANIGYMFDSEALMYGYRDYFVYYLINCALENVPGYLLTLPDLNKIIEYDKKHDIDNMELLRIYFEQKCSINNVAEVMHLHRNSVRYRVNKIEDLLGMPLNDSETRLKIMLSLKIFEVMHTKVE